jgi:crossover junction endodeoxyribonuclease RuvC
LGPAYPAEHMFDGRVLGVDPGTAAVGLAVIDGERRPVIVWAQTLRTPAGLAQEARLRRLFEGVRDAIDAHRPAVMALERLMWGRNTESAMAVARASGVVMLAAAEAGIPVEEYAPLEVKMAVTGVGNATKETVRRSLGRLIGVQDVPSDPDAADAVAVAVCHLQQARMRRIVRQVAT